MPDRDERGRATPRHRASGRRSSPAPVEQIDAPLDEERARAEVARRRADAEAQRRALFESLLLDDPLADGEPEAMDGPPAEVVAVLVAHDGERWLPETLAALRAQTRPPERLVVVDTGSTDSTAELLSTAGAAVRMVRLERSTGYGDAVRAGLAALAAQVTTAIGSSDRPSPHRRDPGRSGVAWIWLLHDDSAPEPAALAALLTHAAHTPRAAVLGAKAVDWHHPDRLVEVGLTTDRAGRRVVDLEPFELDQGQHDQPRDVLAVGTAGALIKREIWDALDGFDARLALLREDIDFGWRVNLAGHRVVVVPRAKVRHARATLTDRRSRDAALGRLHRLDRQHGLYVVLANSGPLGGGLVGGPVLVLAGLLRALAQLVTRRPRAAADEIAALAGVLLHPAALAAARWRRRRTRTVPWSTPRPLLVRTGSRLRASLLATTDRLSGSGGLAASGPPGEDEDIPGDDGRFLTRLVLRPVVGLVAVLAVLGVIGERGLLHRGALRGGRLLPVPAGSRDLWQSYAASWHPGQLGSASAASPWEPIVAAAGIVFGGSPSLAMTVVFLAALPLTGLSAWLATRRSGLSTKIRLWVAATYAVLPPVSGALATGRFDALVAIIAIPLLLSGGHRVLTSDPRQGGWNHAFALGLGLAVAAAFYPPLWLACAVLLTAGVTVSVLRPGPGGREASVRRVSVAAIAVCVTPLLLLPYAPSFVRAPCQLLVGLGIPGGVAGQPGPSRTSFDLLLLDPGGPALPPAWITVPLLLAAAVGLLRVAGARAAGFGAALAVTGYAFALLAGRTAAGADGRRPFGWPGPPLALAAAGLLLASAIAARRARDTFARMSLGPRQPAAAVLAVLAMALPIAAAGVLVVRGADGSLGRGTDDSLPAFVRNDARGDPGQRLLTLRAQGTTLSDGTIGYTVGDISGPVLGDEDLMGSVRTSRVLAAAVADLLSDRGTDAAEVLATFHVRYVALPAAQATPGAPGAALPTILDAQPALSRFAVPGPTLLWQVLVPSSRVEIATGGVAIAALTASTPQAPLNRGPELDALRTSPLIPVRSGREGARTEIPAAATGGQRLLVLSESAQGGWVATLDGRPLVARTAWNWAQAFDLPPEGGLLRLHHRHAGRSTALTVQVVSFAVVLVLAAPTVRRRFDDGFDTTDFADDSAADPRVGTAPVRASAGGR